MENPYSQVSSGYAHPGPLSGDGTYGAARPQAAAAVPTYAAVDKSKKKKKKKKDKKKKDEKEDYTYAEVDTSKKSGKKVCIRNPTIYNSEGICINFSIGLWFFTSLHALLHFFFALGLHKRGKLLSTTIFNIQLLVLGNAFRTRKV